MVKKIIYILLFVFVFYAGVVYAAEFSVSTDKTEYQLGETIRINIFGIESLNLTEDDKIFGGIIFPNKQLFNFYDLDFEVRQAKNNYQLTFQVAEDWEPGQYRVGVSVLKKDGSQQDYEMEFTVSGTKKTLEAEILICADRNCSEMQSVFIKNQLIYFQVKSKELGLQVSGKYQPFGKKEAVDLNFQNGLAEINLEAAGSYEVMVNISKDGFRDLGLKRDFAIINEPAQIKTVIACNLDGQCAGEENTQNCPQDCLKPVSTVKVSKLPLILGVAGGVLLVIILVVIFIIIRRKRRTKTDFQEPKQEPPAV